MVREADPKDTPRAEAFALWMRAPNPMVTLIRTLDVTHLVRFSRKRGLKFNMLMDFCVGQAAEQVKEFYLLPVDGRLMRYDTLAVSAIVKNRNGGVSSCDIRFTGDLEQFNREYLEQTRRAAERCENRDLADCMVIGTSAIVDTELDGAVGMYSGIYNNPFLIWGRYKRKWFRYTLAVSFQFHHTQMDGAHAGRFLANLQGAVNGLKQTEHRGE